MNIMLDVKNTLKCIRRNTLKLEKGSTDRHVLIESGGRVSCSKGNLIYNRNRVILWKFLSFDNFCAVLE